MVASEVLVQDRLKPQKDLMQTIGLDKILDNSQTDFDLFLDLTASAPETGGLVLYANAPYKWTLGELRRLLDDGHKDLYYFTADQPLVEAYLALHHQIRPIDTTSAPAERVVDLTEAAAELTRVLYDHPLTDAAVAKGAEIATAMVDCVKEDRSCVRAIGHLANHDYYTYYHSARVSAYSLAIAMQLGLSDQTSLESMALGCLLHDVGKSKIQLEVLNKKGAFTKEEWNLMREHPVLGHELVADSLLEQVPRSIILHHHERFDGTGYPHNLTENEILEEVKIAAFADVFDALTTNRPYQVSRTRFEALDFIRHRLLKNLHTDSYRAMIELLGLDPEKPETLAAQIEKEQAAQSSDKGSKTDVDGSSK